MVAYYCELGYYYVCEMALQALLFHLFKDAVRYSVSFVPLGRWEFVSYVRPR